ncbi:hypothetical protein [Pseudomonas oryzihabitans]|uniref:hypothetical protein n=1 Tax=Pseudomonas oryzihabitans TaxID=47885 RepID=UPI0011AACD2C|nr:hypothetical protein [Pseudomonas psychrotolerans]
MRRFLILTGLLLVAGQALAEDQCALQLQKLDDQALTTRSGSLGNQQQSPQVTKLIAKAKSYQKAGDYQNCQRTSQEALTLIKQTGGGSAQ